MALVISSMVGTGVFTSLGYQLASVQNTWTIIILWVLGGFIALIGAFTYAELGTHFKGNGGDYVFLSRTFHPILGYLYAWTSLTVGFSAPVAIAALAMAEYLGNPLGIGDYAEYLGIGVILLMAIVHSNSLKTSSLFQDVSSLFKVLFVIVLIIIGGTYAPEVTPAFNYDASWTTELWMPGFAVSLIYVTYAYQGWNQAAYIIDEINEPKKNIPIALIGGTLIVMLIYVGLQLVMLKHGTVNQLAGQADVTTISFANILGEQGVLWISVCIAIQLIATISSYVWIGARITQAMAAEHPLWSYLSAKNEANIPVRAIWFQTIISVSLVVFVSLEQVMFYAGFILQLMSSFSIAVVFFIKPKAGAFRSPGGRVLQVIYILFSIVVLGYTFTERPFESAGGVLLLLVGLLTYFIKRPKVELK